MYGPLNVTALLAVLLILLLAFIVWSLRHMNALSKRNQELLERNGQLYEVARFQKELAMAWETLAVMKDLVRKYIGALVAVTQYQPAPPPKPRARRGLATDTVLMDDDGNAIAPGAGGTDAEGPITALHRAEERIVEAARVLVILGGSRSVIVYSLRTVLESGCSQQASPIKAGLLDVAFGRLSEKIMRLQRPS